MENNHSKPHAVLFPYPLQGHVIPAVHLAIKLASSGFTVTFVNTRAVHHQIIKSQSPDNAIEDDVNIFNGVCKSSLDIRYATISDGFPIGFDRSLNHDQFWEGVLHVFPAHVDELVAKLVRSDPPVTCLIADTFFVWPTMMATKYNLVNVSFWTEPVLVLTLYYHIYLLRENCHFASRDNHRKDTIDYIPGVKAIEPKDLMSYLQATEVTSVEHRIIFKAFEEVKRADFILCNTVQELESDTISALQEKQPTYAIGPIFPNGFTKSTVATSLWSESNCIEWLNTKLHDSILYVSFGSYAHASKKDIEEIANGLSLSRVGFIWALRPDIVSSNETQILPIGFEDEIKNRGLIVPWCSQIEVISHPAIGGFLTHCGWNSILESIWCGLPLLCYPLLTDQFTNRKLVVDDWKVGINLCDRKPITKEEVKEKVNRLMSGKSSEELRRNAKEVKNTLESALDEDGSSNRNFNRFIDDVKAKIQDKHGLGIKALNGNR
ncbi:putative hexosyltransferase [Rosa chinensis]|uniref:Glycosyltransferase n=1 Tax=Rosa chinensis TaxID=74649 RepID=A0A2P6RAY0_ROSCH|nr:UDP-glycosyltransferase 86A1 [Rosa chinensis]PRQ43589.1 putative hexosyltransferase [Rosa chinensis]